MQKAQPKQSKLQSIRHTKRTTIKNKKSLFSTTKSISKLNHHKQSQLKHNTIIHSHLFKSTSITMSQSDESSPDFGSKVKVYTKTGDKGTTTLYNMQRISKTSDYFDALGNTDEINSTIGLAREYFLQIPKVIQHKLLLKEQNIEPNVETIFQLDNAKTTNTNQIGDIINLDAQLQIIQSRLLDIGSCIATPISSSPDQRISRVQFDPEHITQLEHWIDEFDAQLPPLTVFILPSGGLSASTLHVARTIARRAERSVIPLYERNDIDIAVMQYLNRLSDYFFMAARYTCKIEGKDEVTYKKPTSRQLKQDSECTGLNVNKVE